MFLFRMYIIVIIVLLIVLYVFISVHAHTRAFVRMCIFINEAIQLVNCVVGAPLLLSSL